MEHTEAVQLNAAERYVLGELSSELREQFEAHFFGCIECAKEVETGATFVDAAREVLSTQEAAAAVVAQPRRENKGWFAKCLRPAVLVPALALLLLVVGYQNVVVLPHMKMALSDMDAPRTLTWFSLTSGASRGEPSQKISVPQGRAFSLFVDIPPESRFASYACDLETESGTLVRTWIVSSTEAGKAIQVLVPSSASKPGNYVLVVRGLGVAEEGKTSKVEIARYPFTLDYAK